MTAEGSKMTAEVITEERTLKDYIEMGVDKLGNMQKLAAHLGQYDSGLRAMKRGDVGLPVPICYTLAELIDVDPAKIIAVSNLNTAKKPEHIEALKKYLSRAAMIVFVLNISVFTSTSEAKSMLHNNNTLQNIVTFYTL